MNDVTALTAQYFLAVEQLLSSEESKALQLQTQFIAECGRIAFA